MSSAFRRWGVRIVAWLGLALCIFAVWRGSKSVSMEGLGLATWGMLLLVPITAWWLSVAAWRQLVRAYSGEALAWRVAFRQSGVLLIGKYVPGGVFGFLARLYDSPGAGTDRRQLSAGLSEQLMGFIVPTLVGATYYGAALAQQFWMLTMLAMIPLLAVLGAVSAERLGRYALKRRVGEGRRGKEFNQRLLLAACFSTLQQVAWAALTWQLASDISNLAPVAALGVAGSFGLAIAAGMAVVVAPGGLGVREGALVALTLPWLHPVHAVVVAAIMRLCSAALDLLAGAIAFALGRRAFN